VWKKRRRVDGVGRPKFVFHTDPNKCLGILAGCAKDKLFTQVSLAFVTA